LGEQFPQRLAALSCSGLHLAEQRLGNLYSCLHRGSARPQVLGMAPYLPYLRLGDSSDDRRFIGMAFASFLDVLSSSHGEIDEQTSLDSTSTGIGIWRGTVGVCRCGE